LCLACLSPDPADRPTAEELEHGLAAAAGQPAAAAVAMPTVVSDPYQLDDEPDTRSDQRLPRPLLALLIAAAVVLAGAVLYLSTILFSGDPEQASPPALSSTPAITDTPTTDATQPPTTPSAESSAIPTTTTAQAIVDQLDATITNALAAGRIDADAADSVRDKIKDLRAGLSGNKVGRKALLQPLIGAR
jgi:serine/threonine-protein kinase